MRILQLSDIHGNGGYIARIKEIIESADVIAITGDIAAAGRPESAADIIKEIESYNSNILAVHGNWDSSYVENFLNERGYNIHGRGRIISGTGFFGLGGASPTPMKTPVEYSEDDIFNFLKSGYSEISSTRNIVLLSHPPPKGTRDRTFLGLRGGSRSVREFILKYRVDICLTGHIHESSGIETLGSCTVANPGAFKKGRYLTLSHDDKSAGNWKIDLFKL